MDREIIDSVIDGDEEACKEIYDLYKSEDEKSKTDLILKNKNFVMKWGGCVQE